MLILPLSFTLCQNTLPSEPTAEIDGSYIYHYPSGEVEILNILNSPSVYKQFFYLNDSTYKNNCLPQFTNCGSWMADKPELRFENWLSICFQSRWPNKIVSPQKYYMRNIYWHKASKHSDARLDINPDDSQYFLVKIADSSNACP